MRKQTATTNYIYATKTNKNTTNINGNKRAKIQQYTQK